MTDLPDVTAPAAPAEALQDEARQHTYRRAVWIATAVGAALRLAVWASKWSTDLILNDSFYYWAQANNNANGRWFTEFWGDQPGAEHAPLTSLILTPIGLIHDENIEQPMMRLLMTAFGIALIPLVASLARRVAGRRVAVVAAAIAALYPNLWLSDALIMSETISNVAIVLVLIAAVVHRERFTPTSAAVLGALVGVAGLARAEVLVLAPLLALVGLRSHPKAQWFGRFVVIGIASVVMIAPWALYNRSRFDAPVLLSTNEGTTLLGANCPDTYWGPKMGGWVLTCLYDPDEPAGLDTAERNQRRRQMAIDYANGNRERLPLVVGARVARMLDLFGWDDQITGDVGEERARWGVIAGMASWLVLFPLAAVGWWRNRRGPAGLLVAPFVSVVLVTVIFYGAHRLRSPVETAVVVCASITICSLAPVKRRVDHWLAQREISEEAASSPA